MKPSKQVIWQQKMIAQCRCKICGTELDSPNLKLCDFHRKQKNQHNKDYRLRQKRRLTV